MKPKLIHTISTLGLMFISLVGIGLLQRPQLRQLTNQQATLSTDEYAEQATQEEAQLNLLSKVPVFGFDNLFADWIFLRFTQYFGDEPARQATGVQLSPEYFEVIFDHDPRFQQAYIFLSGSTSLYAGMPERTVEIMNHYLTELSPTVPPRAYYIWRYKGTDELLFLGDTDAATNSFFTSADWASVYDDESSKRFERSTRQTAQFLENNPDSRAARISSWLIVYSNAFDQATQQLAIQQIESLGATLSVTEEGRVDIQFPEEPENQ